MVRASGAPGVPGREPPSRGLLILAGFGAMALAGGSVYVFFQGRDAMQYRDSLGDAALAEAKAQGDAAPAADAAPAVEPGIAADAGIAAVPATTPAPRDDHPPVRPTGNTDPVARPRDPGSRPARPDPRPADPAPRVDPPPTRPAGTATLTVGADPWGNVILDGKRIGRTPIEHLAIPAGRHAIEVTFSGEDPPRTLKYTVDLGDGETRTVQADFTKP